MNLVHKLFTVNAFKLLVAGRCSQLNLYLFALPLFLFFPTTVSSQVDGRYFSLFAYVFCPLVLVMAGCVFLHWLEWMVC